MDLLQGFAHADSNIITEKRLNITCKSSLPGIGFHQDYKPDKVNFVGSERLVEELLYKWNSSTNSFINIIKILYGGF